MNIYHSSDKIDFSDDIPSIYLSGPTPRSPDVPSWRKEAIGLLMDAHFSGHVYVPERTTWDTPETHYDDWEVICLHQATCVLFWVPRDLKTMLGLNTNVEFGFCMATRPDSCVYGRPVAAPKNKYLDWLYENSTGHVPLNNLSDTVSAAVDCAKNIVQERINRWYKIHDQMENNWD